MNSKPTWLASRTILAVKPDGQATTVTLRVGTPYEISLEEWACPVAMDGLQDGLRDVHGIDAWQTLQLALSLQAQLLSYFIQEGGKLFCHEPPEPIALDELFPKVPVASSGTK